MSNNKSTEETMDKQRQDRQQKEQYDNVAGLGWKKFGIAFLVIVLAVIIYAVFSIKGRDSGIRIIPLTGHLTSEKIDFLYIQRNTLA